MSDLEVYPFATQDGKAIPLDILKPSYLIHVPFTTSDLSVSLPEAGQVAIFMATAGALISFDGAITYTSGVWEQAQVLYAPADVIVSSTLLNTDIVVRGVNASGSLWIQIIEKWAGLALPKQYSRK